MKKLIFLPLLLITINLFSQTSLTQGDIAFTGWNLDGNDDYSFILLKAVETGTMIKFTDCGWSDVSSSFSCSAGDANGWTWTSSGNLSIGQSITITVPSLTASIGSVSGTAGVMSGLGDQIFAYQGSASSPIFITGMHSNESPISANDANWNGNVTNNQSSALPNVLTNGVNAVRLHAGSTESDNWQYNCAVVSGNIPTIRSAINNVANWVNNNLTPYSPITPACSWSISTLPIELTSFTVSSNGNHVDINWTTASETDNDYFSIENSTDGQNWNEISKVNGVGTSFTITKYHTIDPNPQLGVSYYRLKQTDFNGNFDYSPIVSIKTGQSDSEVAIYPNPVAHELTIEGASIELEAFRLFDFLGQDVTSSIKIISKNSLHIKIDLSALNSGFYLIKTHTAVEKISKL